MPISLRSLLQRVTAVTVCLSLVFPSVVSAATVLNAEDLKNLSLNAPLYGGVDGQPGSACSTTPTDAGLTGSDNQQKAYNYFFAKLGSDFQAAAIVGNLVQESGVNPKADQASGPGRGIAQWSDPGRWTTLVQYAGSNDPNLLGTQLNFLWAELNATPPAGDYTASLSALKSTTTVEDATRVFEENYERAGNPQLALRIEYAKKALQSYGGGATGGAVSGATASCASSAGAVDCSSSGGVAGSLSQTRQNVVCLTQAELTKWDSGQLKAGSDFMKYYSQGRDEEWCADFVSYIYKSANYPMTSSDGNVSAVDQVIDLGKAGGKFSYHEANGYIPVPGDLVVYKLGWSHVNIVVAVNQNEKSMEVIGGNQSGTGPNTSSKVTQYKITGFGTSSESHVIGYVSPNN